MDAARGRSSISAAEAFVRRGWPVFPLRGKSPLAGTRGCLDATLDLAEIERWPQGVNGGAETVICPGGFVVQPGDFREFVDDAHPRRTGARRRPGRPSRRARSFFTWRRLAERLIRALALPAVDCSGLAEFL